MPCFLSRNLLAGASRISSVLDPPPGILMPWTPIHPENITQNALKRHGLAVLISLDASVGIEWLPVQYRVEGKRFTLQLPLQGHQERPRVGHEEEPVAAEIGRAH